MQGTRRPDLTLLLDVPVQRRTCSAPANAMRAPAPGMPKIASRRSAQEFFERVRAAYLARAAAEPERIAVIDARRPADEVTAQIAAALASRAWIS